MSDTKTNNSRLRNPGGKRGPDNRPARTRGPGRTSPVRPEEVLPMGPAGAAESLGGYRALCRRALQVSTDEGAPLALARSRATLATWDVVGSATVEEAERARVEEFAAFLVKRGEAHPLRSLPGDKVRRGGKR